MYKQDCQRQYRFSQAAYHMTREGLYNTEFCMLSLQGWMRTPSH